MKGAHWLKVEENRYQTGKRYQKAGEHHFLKA